MADVRVVHLTKGRSHRVVCGLKRTKHKLLSTTDPGEVTCVKCNAQHRKTQKVRKCLRCRKPGPDWICPRCREKNEEIINTIGLEAAMMPSWW